MQDLAAYFSGVLRSLINVCVVTWRLPNKRCYIFVNCCYAVCPNVRVWVSRKRKVMSFAISDSNLP